MCEIREEDPGRGGVGSDRRGVNTDKRVREVEERKSRWMDKRGME